VLEIFFSFASGGWAGLTYILTQSAPYIFAQYEPKVDFFDTFSKEFLVSNFTKIRPVGDTMIRADRIDRRADVTNVTGAFFCEYAKGPKNA